MATQAESALIALIQLAQRASLAEDEQGFGFVAVNETHFLVPYRPRG